MGEYISLFLGNLLPDRLVEVISYFITASIEILLLIFIIMTVVSLLESYIDKDTLRKRIERGRFGTSYLFACFLGVITPFCSCSSIPMFIGFLKSRIPLGVALSFLVTSPLVNEIVFIILGSMFSWKIATLYAILGIGLGVMVGVIVDMLGLERHIQLDLDEKKGCCNSSTSEAKISKIYFMERVKKAMGEALKVVKDMYKVVLIGIGIGAWIHGYVPQNLIVDTLGSLGAAAIPIATILGIPMYASVAAVVPIVAPLPGLGVSIGTTVAFLMSVAALSLPEALMLKRVMSWTLISLFFAIVAAGIMFIGYSIDFLYVL